MLSPHWGDNVGLLKWLLFPQVRQRGVDAPQIGSR